MNIEYPVLIGEIAKRGYKKNAIAKKIGICPRALTNKLNGKTDFTWKEIKVIQKEFFPDMTKDELFKTLHELNKDAS